MSLPPCPYRFGIFEVEPLSGELRKNGVRFKLQDQPFHVLIKLLENAGKIVTREDLQSALWPADTFVDFDTGLNTAIKRLREVLGDSAERPLFIETLPRRGYRFIAPVTFPGRQPATSMPSRLRLGWAFGSLAAVIMAVFVALILGGVGGRLFGPKPSSRIQSLAVLPLENLSHDPAQDYFTDGMTDELITELAKVSALRVISRTSVMEYKGARKALPKIAQELHVEAVIEGSVLRAGDRVRITVQLVEAATDRHLWGESYERDLRDVLGLQRQLANAIAREIQIKVTPQEQAHLAASARPVSPEAYQFYLKGRYFWNKRTGDDLRKALGYFQRAIDLDPNYALAYTGLADCYVLLSDSGDLPSNDGFPRAKAAGLKALEIEDKLAEAYPSLAWVRCFYDWDYPGAEINFKRAIELNPNYATAHHWYGWYLAVMGRFEEAIEQIKRAQELDPLSLIINTNLGRVLYFAHRFDEAIQQYNKTLELDPNFVRAHAGLAITYEATGMQTEAVGEWLKAWTLSRDSPQELAELKEAYRAAGARGFWKEELNLVPKERRHSYCSEADLAYIYVRLGDKNATLKCLETAYAEHSGSLVYLKVEPLFDSVRSDPRFQLLLRRIGLPL